MGIMSLMTAKNHVQKHSGKCVDLGELSTPEPIDLDTICIQVVCEAVDNQANI